MTDGVGAPPVEPFFLEADGGQRFCLYHPPVGRARGALLYLHPFAEEMNRARRMAALQARAFTRAGHAVLQIDLAGCGDSSGDFGQARWDTWRADVALGADWLRARVDAPLRLWGLRLGALLALDYARLQDAQPVAGMLLWQPVLKGSTCLTQFLRLRLAGAMLAEGQAQGGTRNRRLRYRARTGRRARCTRAARGHAARLSGRLVRGGVGTGRGCLARRCPRRRRLAGARCRPAPASGPRRPVLGHQRNHRERPLARRDIVRAGGTTP